MKQLFLFLGTLILITCSSKTNSQKDQFNNYLSKLSNISLPLKISCGLDSGTIDTIGLSKFKKYIPNNVQRIYGLAKSKDSISLILYGQVGDDIYPYLYSYDSNGKILDSLFLILNPCGGADDKIIPHSSAIINENLSIDLIDTIRYLADKNKMNHSIDSILISEKLYHLDSKGNFKLIKEQNTK